MNEEEFESWLALLGWKYSAARHYVECREGNTKMQPVYAKWESGGYKITKSPRSIYRLRNNVGTITYVASKHNPGTIDIMFNEVKNI
jgi:hypothetical protein